MTTPAPTPGLIGVDLSTYARTIVPIVTPLRNLLPRITVDRETHTCSWRAITSFATGSAYTCTDMVAEPMHCALDWQIDAVPDTPDGYRNAIYGVMQQEEAALFRQIQAQAEARPNGAAIAHWRPGHSTLTSELDHLFIAAYNTAAADPDFLLMSPATSWALTKYIMDMSATRYVISETGATDSRKVIATDPLCRVSRITHYLNVCTGKEIPIVVGREYPDGVIMGISVTLPYPVEEYPYGIDVAVSQDYWGIPFAATNTMPAMAQVHVESLARVKFLGGIVLLTDIPVDPKVVLAGGQTTHQHEETYDDRDHV